MYGKVSLAFYLFIEINDKNYKTGETSYSVGILSFSFLLSDIYSHIFS